MGEFGVTVARRGLPPNSHGRCPEPSFRSSTTTLSFGYRIRIVVTSSSRFKSSTPGSSSSVQLWPFRSSTKAPDPAVSVTCVGTDLTMLRSFSRSAARKFATVRVTPLLWIFGDISPSPHCSPTGIVVCRNLNKRQVMRLFRWTNCEPPTGSRRRGPCESASNRTAHQLSCADS